MSNQSNPEADGISTNPNDIQSCGTPPEPSNATVAPLAVQGDAGNDGRSSEDDGVQSPQKGKAKGKAAATKRLKKRGNPRNWVGEQLKYLEDHEEAYYDVPLKGLKGRNTGLEGFWITTLGGFWEKFPWQDIVKQRLGADIELTVMVKENLLAQVNKVCIQSCLRLDTHSLCSLLSNGTNTARLPSRSERRTRGRSLLRSFVNCLILCQRLPT